MKVNVWKLGYTSFKDYLRWDKPKAECRDMGSVELDKKKRSMGRRGMASFKLVLLEL